MGYFVYPVNTDSIPADAQAGRFHSVSFLYDRSGNRKYLTASERTAFLKAAQKFPDEVRTFCLMLTYTGARISEVLALRSERIDFAAHLVIFESLKKRRRGLFRAVPIPSDLLTELDRVHGIRAAQQEPTLAQRKLWPWCRTTAWSYVKACMTAARISSAQASPKGLRHAFAVAALQAGVPINFVKKWLGHARLSTTEIYADAVGAEEQTIATRLWKTF